MKPAWLEAIFGEKFFVSCSIHESARKNEKNICCLDCCTSICPHCVTSHRLHRLLQIRRYVYHDVVRLEDLEKLIDCSNVQAYTINRGKVVFLRKRPQNRQFKGSGNYCTSCDRCLQEPFIHCSLGCKLEKNTLQTKWRWETLALKLMVRRDILVEVLENKLRKRKKQMHFCCSRCPIKVVEFVEYGSLANHNTYYSHFGKD
ncbi:DNA-binding transcription factor [Lithospermum erythrorhizon]|uniref:DNA-binding transcription factor n=1 Tax=Lithospermum erythrorhizon TaxID=34254 RepID=A0AAV3PWI9_LITER